MQYFVVIFEVLALAVLAIFLGSYLLGSEGVVSFIGPLMDFTTQFRAMVTEKMIGLGVSTGASGITGGISDMFTETNNTGETNGAGG